MHRFIHTISDDLLAKHSQIIIEDAVNLGWWGPKVPVDWTFATNTSGIFFGEPDWVQIGTHLALNPKTRTRGNSFTLTMNETGKHHLHKCSASRQLIDLTTDEHNFLTWLIFQTNRSDIPSTPISEEISYQLSISGKFPCAHPVGNNTCASNKIDLTPDAWNTYGVDKFFEDWYNNRASTFADHGGMMQVFGRDFKIGELSHHMLYHATANNPRQEVAIHALLTTHATWSAAAVTCQTTAKTKILHKFILSGRHSRTSATC